MTLQVAKGLVEHSKQMDGVALVKTWRSEGYHVSWEWSSSVPYKASNQHNLNFECASE